MPMFMLLAEAAAAQGYDLAPAVSMIGSLGFAVWYAWYTTTIAIPKLLDLHRQERQEMQTRFDETIHDLLSEMKEQRQLFAQQCQQFAQWMARPPG